jgi:hypothetical protein
MLHTIYIDDSNSKAKALLEYLKSLDFVTFNNEDLPEWQKLELDKSLENHYNASVQYTSWNDVKQELYKKYDSK